MKKVNLLKAFCIAGTILTTTVSYATVRGRQHSHNCPTTKWTLIDSKQLVAGACTEVQSLQLAEKMMCYSKLVPQCGYSVKYWLGAYTKTIETQNRYLREVYNCNGDLVSEREIVETTQYKKTFGINNPNLDPGLETSYEMVPLTDQEARAAMQNARQKCENYK